MKTELMSVVSEAQIEFGRRLGLDLTGVTVGVARAMLDDAVDSLFHGKNDLGTPTSKQIDLAKKFDRDISSVSRRVGNAVIDQIMTQLNLEAIANHRLGPGVVVQNKNEISGQKYTISSVAEDGTVYFRGGNGAKAWARSLVRAGD